MRTGYLWIVILLNVWSVINVKAQRQGQYVASNNRIIITHITIIDTKNSTVMADRNVEINNGRIVSISKGRHLINGRIQIINGTQQP